MTQCKVIKFEEVLPYISGETICIACGDKGVSVAPVGCSFLECDKCGAMKKVFKYACERDGPQWVCNCGNELFLINPEGIYCPNCGAWQVGY